MSGLTPGKQDRLSNKKTVLYSFIISGIVIVIFIVFLVNLYKKDNPQQFTQKVDTSKVHDKLPAYEFLNQADKDTIRVFTEVSNDNDLILLNDYLHMTYKATVNNLIVSYYNDRDVNSRNLTGYMIKFPDGKAVLYKKGETGWKEIKKY